MVVDGTLVGATQDSAAINQFLNEQKAPYETGQENLTVRFAHEVELVPGVYFTETLISEEELAARLLGQVAWTLASGEQVQQNYLTVQQVFRETYEETVPYPTQEVENSDLAWGKRVPLQEGIDGTKLVTADVVYQDGQEQGRTIVSEAPDRTRTGPSVVCTASFCSGFNWSSQAKVGIKAAVLL